MADEVLPFHNEFTKYYDLDLPIHPKNLAMMLHPHWGFYCKFMKNEFNLEDILNFYQTEYVSSHFRNIGKVFKNLFLFNRIFLAIELLHIIIGKSLTEI